MEAVLRTAHPGSDTTIVTQGDLDDYEPDPNAEATAIVREHQWMQQYLAGLEKNPDRSEKDFAICRTFIAAGVLEEEARSLMENSGATKVGAADASANYWSSTWNRARLSEEQAKANESDDEGPDEKNDLGQTSWKYVRHQYKNRSAKFGRASAASALEDRTSWMYVREQDRLWCYDDDSGTFNEWGKQIASGMLESGLQAEFSRAQRNEIIARIEARNQVHRRELNGGEHPEKLVCVGNGVVDLETGELLDHSPDYRFTRGLRWDYDPENADPEPVRSFLDEITHRPEDRDTILDHLAHGIMPGHPYRAFVLTYGEGANGKTQLQDLIEGFVGDDNAAGVSLSALAGGDDFATGALPGAFVNIGDDEGTSEIRDTSVLKSLTGGGTRRANEKNEKQFEFTSEAAMFFSANEPPRITEQKGSIDDRLYPIQMPYQFKSADEYDPENPLHRHKVPEIAKKLTADEDAMKGLLALVVEHAQRLIESDGQYSMPEGPTERRTLYDAASDPISRFVVRCLEQGEDEDMIAKDDVYAAYTALCRAEDERMTDIDSFKRQFAKKSTLDVGTARPNDLTPSGGRDNAWTHIRFSVEAQPFLSDRLIERYFGDGEEDADDAEAAENTSDTIADLAAAIIDLEHGGNPYRTLTARVEKVEEPPENGPAAAGVLADETGKIDYVAWDISTATAILSDTNNEGRNLLIFDARMSTDGDGNDVLDIEHANIQAVGVGVGHLPGPDPGPNETLADGGEDGSPVPDDAEGIGADARRVAHLAEENSQDAVAKSDLAGRASDTYDMDPDRAMAAIERAGERGLLIINGDGVEAI